MRGRMRRQAAQGVERDSGRHEVVHARSVNHKEDQADQRFGRARGAKGGNKLATIPHKVAERAGRVGACLCVRLGQAAQQCRNHGLEERIQEPRVEGSIAGGKDGKLAHRGVRVAAAACEEGQESHLARRLVEFGGEAAEIAE
eukprot:scaffold12884_cov111-Isochrysis_galbana.AAC.6